MIFHHLKSYHQLVHMPREIKKICLSKLRVKSILQGAHLFNLTLHYMLPMCVGISYTSVGHVFSLYSTLMQEMCLSLNMKGQIERRLKY